MDETSPSHRAALMARLGAWLQAAPVLGIAAAMFGIADVVSIIKTSGAGDPVRLNAAMGDVITYVVIAVSLAFIGLVLVAIAITACGYRAKWMFKFLRFYGLLAIVLSLALLLFGHSQLSFYLPFGLFFLIFAQVKRQEFLLALPPKHKLPDCYKLDP